MAGCRAVPLFSWCCALGLLQLLLLASSSASKLFAVESVRTGAWRLVTIDLGTGTRTVVSKTGAEIPYNPGASATDRNHSVLYFIGQPQLTVAAPSSNLTLVGVSLHTGAVTSAVNIPGAAPTAASDEVNVAGLAYASDLDKVVLSISTVANSHLVGTLHPTTGEWTVLATVDLPASVGGVLPESATWVPGEQTYLFQLGVSHVITQFAYDFKTGTLRNASSAQFTDFVFNPHDGMVWGHGVKPGPKGVYWVRTLAKMNSTTLQVEPVESGLGVLTTDSGGPAFDEDEQIMYWMTSLYKDIPCQAYGCTVHLAQLSLANPSAVDTSVVLCQNFNCRTTCNSNITRIQGCSCSHCNLTGCTGCDNPVCTACPGTLNVA